MADHVLPVANARILELGGLRGAAILWVLLGHYFYFGPAVDHQPVGLLHRTYVYVET